MSFLGKEYTAYKQENLEGFLKALGAPEDRIKSALKANPSIKLVKNGDLYTLYLKNPDLTESTFKSGVEFQESFGRSKVPSTFVVEGNTVTQTLKTGHGVITYKRTYTGDELVQLTTFDKWDGVAKSFYKA